MVCSNKRKITRNILPSELIFPFDDDYDEEGVEIVYWRKNWNLRNAILDSNAIEPVAGSEFDYIINTSNQVFEIIKIIVSFMNKEKWEDDSYGSTIWSYEEILPVLQQNVINLVIIAAFMQNNPDIHLIFYDSY